MTHDDKSRFVRAFAAHAAVFNKPVTDDLVGIYWAILSDFLIEDVERAFVMHIKTSRFFPMPAELMELIPSAAIAKHIGADEAWAIALASFDERETVVWTQQIAEAKAIAQDVFNAGDEIGARMAFKDAYNRIIASASTPEWQVCQGWDKDRRSDVVTKAVQLGRLPAGHEQRYLPDPAPTVTVVALIESAADKAPNVLDRDMAARGVAMLRMALGQNNDDGIARREAERKQREFKRAEVLAEVAEKLGELH